MTPRITNWDDLAFASEEVDPESKVFQYTSFGFLDDNDTFYYGQLDAPKTEISHDQLIAALKPVPTTRYSLHHVSEVRHDAFALQRIGAWLDDQASK